jgi:protein PhnA
MAALTHLIKPLTERAGAKCELCEATGALTPIAIPPEGPIDVGRCVILCDACGPQVAGGNLDGDHLRCLQGALWSEVAAVQVVSWRLLHRLQAEHEWAQELLDQAYLEDSVLAWAKQAIGDEERVKTVDSNGTELKTGDSVTLIKALDVKGANFTAKRGTLVKNIRLSDDPGLVEGRVNKTAIFLKTEFIKRAT